MSNKPVMRTVTGLATARGFVSGPVFVYRGDAGLAIPEYLVDPGREDEELMRFRRAHHDVKRDLENLIAALRERTGKADVRVFECHLMMLDDMALVGEIEGFITKGRFNAESAVHKTVDAARSQFERMNDAYFRERVRDLDDVERRLQKALNGFSSDPQLTLTSPAIIVADDLTPSETVQLPQEFTLGFATNGGSTTSHVALLARALGIPAVTGLGDITMRVKPGETVLLDGTNGAVTLDPDEAAIRAFGDLMRRQQEMVNDVVTGAPAGTLKAGGEVLLYANVHPGVPVAGLRELGARGVGLYRSEYLWLNGEAEPSEEEQYRAYRDAVRLTNSLSDQATITIRVLDIGGDKTMAGITSRESNPFLGNRSIRYLLSHREVFRIQLRAILRATVEGNVGILYPMVSCIEEVRQANAILSGVKEELAAEGIAFSHDVLVGAMIEVPAAALNAEAIGAEVDFFSIGTNDLVQYTMAADRGNDEVAHLYQPANPAVLRLMRMTIAAAKKNEIWVGVCGESAADPVIGVLWAAMGVDMLSMSATYIPVVAKILSRLTREDLNEYAAFVRDLPGCSTSQQVVDACTGWLHGKIPDLEEFLI